MMKVRNLTDLFIHELMDIFSAEHQLTDALPKMAARARDASLKKAFETHAIETQRHITRIQEILDILGLQGKADTCHAMKGLIEESNTMISDVADNRAIDAALITVAQKIEHYEIASYGTLIALARTLGYDNAVQLMKETIAEERETDETLTRLATEGLNVQALKKAA